MHESRARWFPTLCVCLPLLMACGEEEDASQGDGGASGRDAAVSGSDAAGSGQPDAAGGGDWLGSEVYGGGEFHLGPVDYEETEWHNACASENRYLPRVRSAQGELLAALWGGLRNVEKSCDSCILVETSRGKSALLRVVSWGETTTNSVDVSPQAFAILDSGEYPRHMSWRFTKCPETGKVMYEFKSGTNEWWSAFWVRNARMPIERVEVMTANHDFRALRYESDGSLVDDTGLGSSFTIRVVAVDGQTLTDSFQMSANTLPGKLLEGAGNFK